MLLGHLSLIVISNNKGAKLKEPWKKDTNNKYSEVMKSIMGLSTASLLLPVFLSRNFLSIEITKPLTEVFGCFIYAAWILFGVSILSGILFQYLSAKWVRLAWGQKAGMFWSEDTSETTIERCMECSFWLSIITFIIGIILTILYFVTFSNGL